MVIAKGIGRYLNECSRLKKAGRVGTALGALPGFPQWSSDPEVIERAILVIEEKAATAKTAIQELKFRSRIIELRHEVTALTSTTNGAGTVISAEDFFIEHVAAYAVANGIQYGAFRMMGVPAPVLTAAGVKR